MRQITALLSKLKAANFASSKEIDLFVKIKTFYKLVMGPTPPLPRQLAKALDKMFGDGSEKYEMPTLQAAMARAGLDVNGSKQGSPSSFRGSFTQLAAVGGSRTSLTLGSAMTLRGSSSALAGGSAVDLLGSYAQLLTGSSSNLMGSSASLSKESSMRLSSGS